MKAALIPINEIERMKALLEYEILDTPSEIQYDDLTALASQICETPVSLVTIIDGNRQWFKSRHGLDASETSRDISFCAHAILQEEIFVVSDTLSDPRFSDNPLVTGSPHVRFYAGVPLVNSNGHALGTICVVDGKPRELTTEQTDSLRALARQVVGQMELRKSKLQLESRFIELQSLTAQLSRSQELIIQTSKMSALGEMAAGIAHEINTPLTIIEAKTRKIQRIILEEDFTPDKIDDSAEKIIATSQRISKIISGLLTFSRNAESDNFSKVEIRKLIGDVLPLCLERFKLNNVKLDISPLPDQVVECRNTQIEQVLLNLLNNAYYAIENLPVKWIKIDFHQTGENYQIIVTDSGDGIKPDIAKKMMQPFFTTREIGKGTGLGLSISKGIVEEHNGKLYYDPSCTNTRFVIELPLLQTKMLAAHAV